MAYEHVGKVAWTIHGGGTNGSYYDKTEINEKNVGYGLDFISVCDVLDRINDNLPDGKKLKTLKIHRWTSPGASLVTNSDIDNKFRYLVAHMNWPQAYESKLNMLRSSLGSKNAHPVVSVGDVYRPQRGPGELLKDLQVFTCDKMKQYADIMTNENLESEYIPGSKSTDEDFGVWISLPNTEDMDSEYYVDKFHKDKQIHDEVFKMGEKSVSQEESGGHRPPVIRMGDAVAEIIILKFQTWDKELTGLPKEVAVQWEKKNPWPLNWEIYPTTCSPISDIAGRQALVKYKKKRKSSRASGPQTVLKYERIDRNSGLWFMYLINLILRIKIFKKGKENNMSRLLERKERVKPENSEKYNWDSKDMPIFENVFDCLDPDERRDIYISYNGILQNIRPNDMRIQAGDDGFHNILTSGTQGRKYNLFKDEDMTSLMDALKKGVSFDDIKGKVSIVSVRAQILLYEIIADFDTLLGGAMKEKNVEKPYVFKAGEYDHIPTLLKFIFYLTYNLSHVDAGNDGDTGEPKHPVFGGIAKKYEVLPKGADPKTGKIKSGKGVDWSMVLIKEFQTYPKETELVSTQDSEKMAKNIRHQWVSSLRHKPNLMENKVAKQGMGNGTRTYDEWQLYPKMEEIIKLIELGDGVITEDTLETVKIAIISILGNGEKLLILPEKLEDTLYEKVKKKTSYNSFVFQKVFKQALEGLIKTKIVIIIKENFGDKTTITWGERGGVVDPETNDPITREDTLQGVTEYYQLNPAKAGGRKRKKRTRRKRRKRRKRKKRTRKKRRIKRKSTKKKRKRTRRRR